LRWIPGTRKSSNSHLRCLPVTIHYPVDQLGQFLEIKKGGLSKISSLEELIKTRLVAATEPRNKSILLNWNTRNNLVDSRSLNHCPRHPNPKTPQLNAILTQKRPILGAYQSFSLRCFRPPRCGACDVQHSVPRGVIKKITLPRLFPRC